jgi:hypothetical protein
MQDPEFLDLVRQKVKLQQGPRPGQPGRGAPWPAMEALNRQMQAKVQALGGNPKDFTFKADGSVDDKSWFGKHWQTIATIAVGGVTGGALLAPLLAPAAPAAGGAGGILPKVLTAADIAQDIGGLADRYNTRKTDDQTAQANYNLDYDKNAIGRYLAELNSSQQQLDRRKYGDDAYQQAISDRVYGSMLQGLQDVTIQAPAGIRVGQITGGLRPSAISNRGDVGSDLETNARDRMQHPTPLPDLPTVPDLSATGLEPSKLDSFMDWLGFAGGASGTATDLYNRLKPPGRSTQPASAPTTLPDLPSWSSSANMYPGGIVPRRYN